MIRTTIILALVASTALGQTPQDPIDQIRKKITKAEDTYTTELAKVQNETIKWMDTRDANARKKGDKTTVNLVKLQREKLETEGTIPKPSPLNISRKIDTARDMLDATYAALLKEALMLKLDDLADELEAKRVQLDKEKTDQNVFKMVSHMTKNLVQNGSFEFPEIPLGLENTPLNDNKWVVNGQNVVRFKGAVPIHGTQMLHLNGDAIQTITGLTPGEQYIATVNFGTYATPGHPNVTSTCEVRIAGEKGIKTASATNRGSKGYAMIGVGSKWEQVVVTFKALGESHDLVISANTSDNHTAVIDNVSVLHYFGN